jgi:hypothetical protein
MLIAAAQDSLLAYGDQTNVVAFGWGTLSLLTAGVAQGKNRSGLAWFLITLFLGPISTFLLVAFFPKLPAGHDSLLEDR